MLRFILFCSIFLLQSILLGIDKYEKDSSNFIGVCSQITRESRFYNPYAVHAELIDLFLSANIRFTRTGFKWKFIHPKKGEWDWRITDQVVRTAKEKGVSILALIGGMPISAMESPMDNIDLWLEFVDSLSTRYKKDIYLWEIWNEPNVRSGKYWPQNALPGSFVNYVIEASKIIRKNQPESFILLGGLATSKKAVPFDVWESMFELNILDHVDGVAYHSYKFSGKRIIEFNKKLKKLINKYSTSKKELWITEFGIPAVKSINGGKFSFEYQKNQILQSILIHWALGGGKFFIFSLWDKVELDPALSKKEIRQNKKGFYGLLKKDLSQKPSYDAVKWLSQVLINYEPIDLIEKNDGVIVIALNKKDGKKGFITWGINTNNKMYKESKKNNLLYVKSFEKNIKLDKNLFNNDSFSGAEVLLWY
jgi:hypothetical protein